MQTMQKNLNDIQETKEHGSALFPFNIYPCTIPEDFPSVPLHWHKNMELIFVKKGKGNIQSGMELVPVQSGDIFVFPPEALHALFPVLGSSMEYENIIFDVSFLGGGAADICDQEYLVPLATGQLLLPVCIHPHTPGYDHVARCLKEAENLCANRPKGYELGVKASIMGLVFLLLSMYPETPSIASADTRRLKNILRYVELHYDSPLSVSSASEICGLSSSHFMRWFKQMTGTSFTAYLNERRLAFAAELLRRTDEKILVIAQNTGFENLSNFNRQFKARYGMTPNQYRILSLQTVHPAPLLKNHQRDSQPDTLFQ